MEDTEDNSSSNKNKFKNKNVDDTPKNVKFRNIPEEDKNAMESFFQNADDNESETDSVIEE